jgi:hypothetical protein
VTLRRDPDARCGTCGVRLSRVGRDHEDRCGRKADGWPPFQDEIESSGLSGSGGAGAIEHAGGQPVGLDAPATRAEARHAAD